MNRAGTSSTMIYGLYALGIAIGVFWPPGWKEAWSSGVFRAAGAGHIHVLLAFVLSIAVTIALPCVPVVVWSLFSYSRLKLRRSLTLLLAAVSIVMLMSALGYDRDDWQREFLRGIQSRLNKMAPPVEWRKWARTILDAHQDKPSGMIAASEIPQFVRNAYPDNRLFALWGRSATADTEAVSLIWRGQMGSWGLKIEFGRPTVIETNNVSWSRLWTNGFSVFLELD